jgi:hypothetical protein
MLSRKTYRAVADLLSRAILKTGKRDHLIEEFCRMFEQDNPRFDRKRFTAACQPKQERGTDSHEKHVKVFNAFMLRKETKP